MTTLHPAPQFGTFDPAEVTWLIQQDPDAREEPPPNPAVLKAFLRSLSDASTITLAKAVGALAEIVAEARAYEPVLVSLNSSGAATGVLMKRWMKRWLRVDPPHYVVSKPNGGHLDLLALDQIRALHPDHFIVFVSPWSARGVTAWELTMDVRYYNRSRDARVSDEIAVISDAGRVTRLYGTRDELLIPSAYLDSTCSGLVGSSYDPGDGSLHRAGFNVSLLREDVTKMYLDAVSWHFSDSRVWAAAYAEMLWAVNMGAPLRIPDHSHHDRLLKVLRDHGGWRAGQVAAGISESLRAVISGDAGTLLADPAKRGTSVMKSLLAAAHRSAVEVIWVDDLPLSSVALPRA